jgi:hypothetical protein
MDHEELFTGNVKDYAN